MKNINQIWMYIRNRSKGIKRGIKTSRQRRRQNGLEIIVRLAILALPKMEINQHVLVTTTKTSQAKLKDLTPMPATTTLIISVTVLSTVKV